MTPEQYAQEFECSFDAAITGAYFGREMAALEAAGRIKDINIDPDLGIHTSWDLGMSDSTVIWVFQVLEHEIRIVDHIESSDHSLDHYTDILRECGYVGGDDWVPQDAKVRSLDTKRTRVETLVSLGRRPALVPAHTVMDGINAVRLALPRCWFDGVRCADGIEALKQYRCDFDEKKRVFSDAPKHDWASDHADSFRYLCMAYRQISPPEPVKANPAFKGFGEMSFDEYDDNSDFVSDRGVQWKKVHPKDESRV